jgi:hydroxymethylpyrimidine/phosphomethylpyrimidine kinase
VVLNDLPVSVIKIGLMGNAEICREIATLAAEHPQIPVIMDPVLAAGGGTDLAEEILLESIRKDLLPQVELVTPNSEEARRISGKDDLVEAASEMFSMGCNNILITGTHEKSEKVVNTLYQESVDNAHSLEWSRLPSNYHGSGCTLASAIAARIALGKPMLQAVTEAQEYTWQTLNQANSYGSGQALPYRVIQ